MSRGPALDRLAARYGIVPSYQDIWGETHPASDETKRALLAAMGAAADSPEAAEASLRAAEAADASRLLPPVSVVDEGATVAVPLSTGADAGLLRWTVTHEDGRVTQGEADAAGADPEPGSEVNGGGARPCLRLNADLPAGYHMLTVTCGERTDTASLIVAPATCFAIEEAVGERRVWGVAAQLYGLRGRDDWGIGDFGDLGELAGIAAATGAVAVGINPVHAGFAADPHHFSPYSPSSRIFLNHLYIDVTAVPEFEDCAEARGLAADGPTAEALAAARQAELVDYPAVAAAKLPVLRALHRHFRASASVDRRAGFEAFRAAWGISLHRHAVFEALHAHFFGRDIHNWSWRTWPEPYRDCESPEVAAFARDNDEEVEFHAWLQWIADAQLAEAQHLAGAAGMPIGIYRDLAVASDGGGSMAWSWPDAVMSGPTVGAPPDDLGPMGQNWGLSPLSPHGLRSAAYLPFIHALRANMRHAGALRIDHVMALTRLFWIPAGKTGREGAYVQYPFEDLIRIVALESRRNRCIVIGEDLGTLPPGFQETLQSFGVLSYRIMSFEREADGRLKPPQSYPERALVAAATHDMPTVRGHWIGRDIDWRGRVVAGITPEWVEANRSDRRRTREQTLAALRAQHLDPGHDVETAPTPDLAEAIHRFIARTPSRLLMVQLEDLLDMEEQANLPGTSHEHPNWRRRLPCPTADLFGHPLARRIVGAVNQERSR